ncbi:MAG: protein BatD [Gammaproteobacteria bacterium]|nr:protein BatD [Gammaproteobacteria bacterium]
MVRYTVKYLLGFILLLATLAQAAEINVSADRDELYASEAFQLIFEVKGAASGKPDFSPLKKYFDILATGQSSSFQWINGETTQTKTYNLTVLAGRTGSITVPAITFGNDKSPSITLNIQAGASKAAPNAGFVDPNSNAQSNNVTTASNVFLEASVDNKNPYVQQQVLYTLRVFRATTINGQLTNPIANDTLVQYLGNDKEYEQLRNNTRYLVTERRFVLFPQSTGTIEIPPVTLTGQMVAVRQRSAYFDPFGQSTQAIRLSSNAIKLNVLAALANQNPWLPAEKISLDEHWSIDPPIFKVGEPITRTITLNARGLMAAQLPSLTSVLSDDFKTYPDQAKLNNKNRDNGVTGTRTESLALVPLTAGEFTLPAISVTWWNSSSKQTETSTIPARTIVVAAAANAINNDATPIAATPTPVKNTDQRWKIASIAFAVLWLVTIIGFYRFYWARRSTAQQNDTSSPYVFKSGNDRDAWRRLQQACTRHDAEQTYHRLLQWAAARWPHENITNLEQLQTQLQDPAVHSAFDELQAARFGAQQASWQGKTLWQALEEWAKNTAVEEKLNKTKETEPHLYKLAKPRQSKQKQPKEK